MLEVKKEAKTEAPVTQVKPQLGGVNMDKLEEREGIAYLKGSDTPYTGKATRLYENGQKQAEANLKNGKEDGLIVLWHENGQKALEKKYEDGEEISANYWNSNGDSVDSLEEAVAEVKPTEDASVKSNLKHEVKDSAVTITGCVIQPSGSLIIPSTIEGKPVTSIRGGAFVFCESLTGITIPDSVTSIGDLCFASCDGLTSIAIPDSVTSIGNEAFAGCTNLRNITIGSGVTSIGDDAFHSCSSLRSITIPDGVTTIGKGTFSNCTDLTAVTFFGDAPKAGEEVFLDVTPTIYRKPEAEGWSDT